MATVKKHQTDNAKFRVNGIKDIYNPDGNNIEKENIKKINKLEFVKDDFKKYISLFRAKPDLLIDLATPEDSNFKLFFYQRVFLRIAMNHRYTYATFTRAFSKSFLSILILFIKCILYPGSKLFVCSAGKEASSKIATEKCKEIFELFPIFEREVKNYRESKDYLKLTFHNGSVLDIVAIQASSRGGRRHGGLIEECILVDGDMLNEIIIPLTNISRRAKNGEVDPDEVHKHQIYVEYYLKVS